MPTAKELIEAIIGEGIRIKRTGPGSEYEWDEIPPETWEVLGLPAPRGADNYLNFAYFEGGDLAVTLPGGYAGYSEKSSYNLQSAAREVNKVASALNRAAISFMGSSGSLDADGYEEEIYNALDALPGWRGS